MLTRSTSANSSSKTSHGLRDGDAMGTKLTLKSLKEHREVLPSHRQDHAVSMRTTTDNLTAWLDLAGMNACHRARVIVTT
ncbi:hypothetical protein PI125_g2000 [Phytophthora idaei]|nr:hypothetical protein PI125_g2000 [Phytophthora idaei]